VKRKLPASSRKEWRMMGTGEQKRNIELDPNGGSSEWAWRAQCAAWCVLLLFLAAAVLGYFGVGPAERAEVSGPGGVRVQHSRFQRMTRTAPLELRLANAATDQVQVALERAYLDRFEITGITPEPESSTATAGQVLFGFRAVPGQPFTARFLLRPAEGTYGRTAGNVVVAGAGEVRISQWIWP
jgi:hypothetical protein